MKFGVCASYKDIAALESPPIDYLEENVQRFLQPEQPDGVFAETWHAARQLPIPIEAANSFIPASLPLIETPIQAVDRPRIERYVKTAFQRAQQVGIKVIVFGSGDARRCPDGYDRAAATRQIADYLAQWSQWATAYGIQLALEPLRYQETNTLNTVAESGQLVEQLVQTGATLLVDTYHMGNNGEAPTDILPFGNIISHVHVAEVQERAAPGRFGEDFHPYFAALHQIGYDRRISIECHWQNMATELGPSIATLKKFWADS
jgi:sugar phosphate isomerase/epimerase